MANQNRNCFLNCRVSEETLKRIDSLRWDGKWSSRADIVEVVFRILSEDLKDSDLKELLWYRSRYMYQIPSWFLSIIER